MTMAYNKKDFKPWYELVPADYANPSDRQVEYAKSLGIDPSGMDRKQIHAAIQKVKNEKNITYTRPSGPPPTEAQIKELKRLRCYSDKLTQHEATRILARLNGVE